MADLKINCPNCGKSIPLTDALTHQLEVEITERVNAEAQEELEKKLSVEINKVRDEAKLEQERKRKEIEDTHILELSDLREQVKEKQEKLDDIREQELELRKRQRELEDKQKELELSITRRVDEEKRNLEGKIADKLTEEYRLKDLEKDKQLNDLRRQIEELKQKAEQGSQQTQGEVAELELEKQLQTNFCDDQIEAVGKGVKGADIVQRVCTKAGNQCGTIIWESKNAKRWSDSWLPKFRDDARIIKADIAILVTTVLPKEITHFAQKDGVWVTDFQSAMSLASALRVGIMEVANAKLSSVGKDEKMENLYTYLSGSEFRQRVEAIVESFVTLQSELQQERRAMEQVWAKREKQLFRAVQSVAGMYGDMKGIIGHTLPKIENLELPAPNINVIEE